MRLLLQYSLDYSLIFHTALALTGGFLYVKLKPFEEKPKLEDSPL